MEAVKEGKKYKMEGHWGIKVKMSMGFLDPQNMNLKLDYTNEQLSG